jgi:hypothetical protein
MRFRQLAIISSLLFFALTVAWMFFPAQMLAQWGVEYSNAAGLVGRRGAVLCAGFAVLFFMARNASHSTTRMALIQGVSTTLILLVLLGIYEFSAGHANHGILTAILIEAVFGLAFLYVWRTSSKTPILSKN